MIDFELPPEVEDVRGLDVHRFNLKRVGKFRFPPRDYARFVLRGDWDVVHVKGQRVWSSDHLYRHVPKLRQPERVCTGADLSACDRSAAAHAADGGRPACR